MFCDIDQDCYGDADICGSNPACPDMRTGCCVQEPALLPKPEGWIPPYNFKDQLSTQVCETLFLVDLYIPQRNVYLDKTF